MKNRYYRHVATYVSKVMPLFLPKRTAELDLPRLDVQTPIKSKNTDDNNKLNDAEERILPTPNTAVKLSAYKHEPFPKRTTDLPPLQPESDSENENNEPNKPYSETDLNSSNSKLDNLVNKLKVEETPTVLENIRENEETLDKCPEMKMLVPKSVLKRTFTTPNTATKLQPAMLKSSSKSEGILRLGSTSRKKSLAKLQVVRSFAPPKSLLSARQLFTSDGREILGDTKKPMMTIHSTPSIFRSLLKKENLLDDTLENMSVTTSNDSGHHSSRNDTLEDTVLNEESHYSKIFDESVAVDRSLPDVDMEQFSKVLEERRPQLVERVAELRGGLLKEISKIEKLAQTPKFNNHKNRLRPHPMSPFKEPQTPPFAIPQAPAPKSVKKIERVYDEQCNINSFIKVDGKHYMLCRSLGKGGSGYVFEACAENNNTHESSSYAIKMVHLHRSATIMEEYVQEIKILKLLQNNEYIIKYFASEVIKENDHKFGYIVMELGQSDLYQHLRTRKEDIPLYELGTWFNEMIHALRVIHSHGIIHSDLKPANFIIVNGHLKLADFGISMCQDLNTSHIEQVVVAGTCNFLSPESVYSVMKNSPAKLSGATDIWSFGIICYYLIYKDLPFGSYVTREDKLKAIVNPKTVINFPPLPDYYPEMLRKMTIDCLQYNSSLRPTAKQLLIRYPLEKIAPVKPWIEKDIT
uniref:CSON013560 protein n=1 Tax=Culicoides sonorensis TaxID=179676 RepID=A0A336M8G1_CULSO